jgi:uncharacterized protein YcbK (DUF882 family)
VILKSSLSEPSYIRFLKPAALPALLGAGLGVALILAGPANQADPSTTAPAPTHAQVPGPQPAPTLAPATPIPAAATQATQVTIEPLLSPQRLVHVESINNGERASFNVGPRGFVPADQVAAVNAFFRCRRTGTEHAISPDVLVLLADISDHWPGHTIEIISGFRAAPFGAPHSRHFSGNAIDLRVRGVRTTAVRDFVWREHEGIGVGHYAEGNFVHVDARSDDQEIAWSSPNEDTLPEYNPAWAKRARRGLHRDRLTAMTMATALEPARARSGAIR